MNRIMIVIINIRDMKLGQPGGSWRHLDGLNFCFRKIGTEIARIFFRIVFAKYFFSFFRKSSVSVC